MVKPGPKEGTFNRGSVPARVVDVLAESDRWLTTAGISVEIPDVTEPHLDRTLWRLKKSGHIQHRNFDPPFTPAEWTTT